MEAYLMVGAPGSGKSTYARTLAKTEDAVVISGDDVRAELYGDANIQGEWNEIQNRIVELIEENVGKPVVLDGTHYRASYRKEAVNLLRSYGYNNITAVVIDKSLEVCLTQNAARSRVVPRHVIVNMHQKLQSSLRGINSEDFERIHYVY
jgi:predicted kinase